MFKIASKLFAHRYLTGITVKRYVSQKSLSNIKGSMVLPSVSSEYLESLYQIWKKDPNKIDQSWNSFFMQYEKSNNNEILDNNNSTNSTNNNSNNNNSTVQITSSNSLLSMTGSDLHLTNPIHVNETYNNKALSLFQYIEAFEKHSHLIANINPLKNNTFSSDSLPSILKPEYYGLQTSDLDLVVPLSRNNLLGIYKKCDFNTVKNIQATLYKEYCGHINVEYMHLTNGDEINWFRDEIDYQSTYSFNNQEKLKLYEDLYHTSLFESFAFSRFGFMAHYSIEGNETLIPGISYLLNFLGTHGVSNVVAAMTTRGRLSFLSSIMNIPYHEIFYELNTRSNYINPYRSNSRTNTESSVPYSEWNNIYSSLYYEGKTTKYSVTPSSITDNITANNISISLLPFSSSYNEIVTAIVIGKTKARQTLYPAYNKQNCVPIVFHGDSTFCSDGLTYEVNFMNNHRSAINQSNINNNINNYDYDCGGIINIILNNQTFSSISSSVSHSTDIMKSLGIPIIHVNANDMESVVLSLLMAAKYRIKYNKSVVVDVIGVNRKDDEKLYQYKYQSPHSVSSSSQPTSLDYYTNQLIHDHVLSYSHISSLESSIQKELTSAYSLRASRANGSNNQSNTINYNSDWIRVKSPLQMSKVQNTGLSLSKIQDLGKSIYSIPSSLSVNSTVKELYTNDYKCIENGCDITWEIAEKLAFASLIDEGNHILYNTQNIDNLNKKYLFLHDIHTQENQIPLSMLSPSYILRKSTSTNNYFHLSTSPLSISPYFAFSLGYSYESPALLSICEPQVYDMTYNIQSIIDNYIAPGEIKYNRQSALVLLLSHGYSYDETRRQVCKLERFLSLCNDDPDYIPPLDINVTRQIQMSNLQICSVTTPSNFYHILRRQLHRQFRKPLILLIPTNIYSTNSITSPLSAFLDDTKFQRVVPDLYIENNKTISKTSIRKIVFCTGKIFYELDRTRQMLGIKDVALIRIEQIAPFPFDSIEQQLNLYPQAKCIWCQEEPKNMGAYQYIKPRFSTTANQLCHRDIPLYYVGRPTSSSSDSVYGYIYKEEQNIFIKQALE